MDTDWSCLKAFMKRDIKEIRESTGLTQKAFAEMFEIPVSTLRKWEQHEAAPPAYLIRLIAKSLPTPEAALEKIKDSKGNTYYYDSGKMAVLDSMGNEILIQENLDGVKRKNLGLYLRELFEAFYDIQEKFNRDCRFDKKEDIIWIE